ncbi:MAG: EamA family transporter RarD, partial [Rhodothermaceae bacterium]
VTFAYIFWGTHPVYWKMLEHISALEIFAYRSIFSLAFIFILISYKKQFKALVAKVKTSEKKVLIFLPSFLIGSNWLIYIWSVNNGFILETSLGYFFSPLIMVMLGVVFLKEKLRKLQWIAIAIASAGVIIMTAIYGHFPVLGALMAVTWSLYGFLRKKSPLNALEGLLIDTFVVSIPAVIALFFTFGDFYNSPAFEVNTILLLIGTGVVSGLPLVMFITGTKTVKYTLIGILQYIYPTLIFLVGAFVYPENLDEAKLIGFSFIWTALIIYTIEGTVALRKKLQTA